MAPTQDNATGELRFGGMPHWICGNCGYMPMICRCLGGQRDMILKGLPPPVPAATPEFLMTRWSSCNMLHMQMGCVDTREWLADHGARARQSMATCDAEFRRRVKWFVDRTILGQRDPDLLKELLVWAGVFTRERPSTPTKSVPPKLAKNAAIARLAQLADASASAFLAGDWGCVTKVGLEILGNAMCWDEEAQQPSRPAGSEWKGSLDALEILHETLDRGYTHRPGGDMAIDMNAEGSAPARWHEALLQPLPPLAPATRASQSKKRARPLPTDEGGNSRSQKRVAD